MPPVTTEMLRGIELFTELDDALLEQLVARAEVHDHRAGDVVIRQGEPALDLQIVIKGTMRLTRDEGGQEEEQERGIVGEGSPIGELSILDGTPHEASAVAIEDGQTISITGIDDLMNSDPATTARSLLGALTRTVANKMRDLEAHVLTNTERLRETQFEIIFRLGRAAEFRDDDTGIHITRMSRFAARVALEIDMESERTELLLHAAPMHDIGKIGIPDSILLKPGKLTDEEFTVMKTHTELGAELLGGSSSPVVQMAQQVALSHHEKWDGSGYPEGLQGENIPLEARICCVVDVFDALISDRPYKQAWSVDDALAEIRRCSGTLFDPTLAEVFLGLEADVKGILARTAAAPSALPAVSRSATMFFLTQQADATP